MSESRSGETSTAPTGVTGLDDILMGGVPRRRLFLVQGDPGVGKTTLGLQFLMEGRSSGERTLYITLAETRDELEGVAASHGWDLGGIDLVELTPPRDAGEDENTLFHPAEVELTETIKTLVEHVARTNPSRLVIDSLSELRLLAQSVLRFRRQLLALKAFFAGGGCTTMLLDDRTGGDGSDRQLETLANAVLSMEQLAPAYGASRRRLRVVKMRGVKFRAGYHDFAIERGGMVVYPRLVAAEHLGASLRERIASGVPELDQMLGGGLDRGTSAVLLGPAGSGKSTLALQLATAAALRGEHAAIFAFDESRATVLARAEALKIPTARAIESGHLRLQQIDPAEMPPGEFAQVVRHSVERQHTRVLVLDSLNGYVHAMPEEQFLMLQLHELLTYLAQQGVLTLVVFAQHGLVGPMQAPVDISYLADAVILLRHFEAGGRVRRAISMLKKRSGAHETSIREMKLVPNVGIQIGPPLHEFEGVLTGVPRYVGSNGPLMSPVDPDDDR